MRGREAAEILGSLVTSLGVDCLQQAIDVAWDRAHSTPLELSADLGLPLACLIVLARLGVLAVLIGVGLRRRDPILPVVVAILRLAYSILDFSLQFTAMRLQYFLKLLSIYVVIHK